MNKLSHLPGVKRVEYVNQFDKVLFKHVGQLGDYPLEVQADFKEICLLDIGRLEISSEPRANQLVNSISLKFETKHLSIKLTEPYYFKVSLVSGESYLLGYEGYPAPLVQAKYKVSNRVTDARCYEVTISWKSSLSPLLLAK